MPVYATLAGVRFDRLFLDADAIAEAYTIGRPMAEALFGADVATGGPTWAGISYGHANSLDTLGGSPSARDYLTKLAS